MTKTDLQNGIFRGSVTMVFAGRSDTVREKEDQLELDNIIGTLESLVN